jgi:hypothetical protein
MMFIITASGVGCNERTLPKKANHIDLCPRNPASPLDLATSDICWQLERLCDPITSWEAKTRGSVLRGDTEENKSRNDVDGGQGTETSAADPFTATCNFILLSTSPLDLARARLL